MAMRLGIAQTVGSGGGELLWALLTNMGDAVYAVDESGRVLFANPAALAILGFRSEEELVGRPSHATIHHSRPDGTTFPESECPLLRPRATGEVVRVEADSFVRRDGSFVPVAYSSAPVMVNGERGAVVVFHDLTDQRRAEEERLRSETLQASRARIVQATMAERRRLGRDLHDGAQQRLVNVMLALKLASEEENLTRARVAIAHALEETKQALGDLRDLGAGLHPSVLSHRGLSAAVVSLTARTPIPVTLEVPAARFPEIVEVTAYFVIAEALANVAKHAGASEASVTVSVMPPWLRLDVADDGRGGATGDLGLGTGLSGLADRVNAVGGTLTLHSPLGEGTRVTAMLPLDPRFSPPGSA